jgi:hypothetical protein
MKTLSDKSSASSSLGPPEHGSSNGAEAAVQEQSFTTPPAAGPPSSSVADQSSRVATIAGVSIAVIAIFGPIVASVWHDLTAVQINPVAIVTSAQRDSLQWQIVGRVLNDGQAMHARVWAIATDEKGNRTSPPPVTTDSFGQFRLGPVPISISSVKDTSLQASEVTVYARSLVKGDTTNAQETIRLNNSARTRWVPLSAPALLTVITIFLISMVAGLAQGRSGGLIRKLQYYSVVALAFLLTTAVVAFISMGLRRVNLTGTEGDVIALGFANIYKGSYVKDISPEWLFSLTAPIAHSAAEGTAKGFGAPLWSLLLACLGAGAFTIRLLVKQVREPVSFTDDGKFRDRLQELVRHQFYILFAPLAAVFVYQFLVAAGAASQPATVALAMLGAGLVLNAVLDRAMVLAKGALESKDDQSTDAKDKSKEKDESTGRGENEEKGGRRD